MRKLFTCILCEATSKGLAVTRSRVDHKICSWCEAQLARTARRRCRKCGNVKALAFFRSHPRWCVPCDQADRAARYQAKRAARLEANRQWTVANRAYKNEQERQRRAAKRDEINARRRAQYAANPAPRRAQSVAWSKAHKATRQAWRARNPGSNAARTKQWRIRRKLAILREVWR